MHKSSIPEKLEHAMTESIQLLTQIDAGRGQQPQEDAFNETPNMQEINTPFAQTGI